MLAAARKLTGFMLAVGISEEAAWMLLSQLCRQLCPGLRSGPASQPPEVCLPMRQQQQLPVLTQHKSSGSAGTFTWV